ncbi:MAG: caspase family protein [Chitinispirillales bacterium]|nr:caspase family protein [Chitinispirillales bacterium]
MKHARILAAALMLLTALTAAANPVRRYLLSAGANNGGKDRVLLRYAVSDATAFAAVMTEMGGVERKNAIVLSDPSGRELLGGIAKLNKIMADAKVANPGIRGEVFVYYSGHADENGLKLGAETLGWSEFRNAVSGFDAEVRIAVLDACGAGAITRAKGGVAQPAFLSDASSNMKGYAFLTSSNENETSQESDRIKGSYFTYALLSGMRGAADMTGDGKVSVSEAYQYAFNETLQYTQNTRAGTQHPSRDMNLVGTGDVVMTDLRETSAALSLDVNLEGRFFIRDKNGNLFAELRKYRGRAIELGMPPGKYSIEAETPSLSWMSGNVEIAANKRAVLSMSDMKAMERKTGVARGDDNAAYSENTPIGRLFNNIIGKTIYGLSYYVELDGLMDVSVYAGMPWLYAQFEYAQPIGSLGRRPKAYGGGLGTRFGMAAPFYVNSDLLLMKFYGDVDTLFDTDGMFDDPVLGNTKGLVTEHKRQSSNYLFKLRLGVNYAPIRYAAFSGGAYLNCLVADRNDEFIIIPKPGVTSGANGDSPPNREQQVDYHETKIRVWPGVYAGITVFVK